MVGVWRTDPAKVPAIAFHELLCLVGSAVLDSA
jgi:hypothetical protein